MADLDDLGFTSITDQSQDEALELLRQIRLARRAPVKTTVVHKAPKEKAAKATDISPEMAAQILKILGGSK